MASKNTDIIEQLADTIVANLTTPIAKRGKETAPNDKTFPAIILGTNQKFTDDVSEEDKTAIIQKFSIPEAVEEGEQNYYTFKINGAYYCKRQNGDFKLYEKINVYIPNGDWSNMYIDRIVDSDPVLPTLIIQVDEPEHGMKLKDYWVKIDDNDTKNIVALYQYRYNETEDENQWVLLYNSGGGNIYITISHAILVQQEDLIT